jgi:hypothetical protein
MGTKMAAMCFPCITHVKCRVCEAEEAGRLHDLLRQQAVAATQELKSTQVIGLSLL